MDNIFGEKPWIEPLSVAGTSCDADSESTSTEKIREQSGNETCYNTHILVCYNAFFYIYSNISKYIFFTAKKRKVSMDKYLEELLEEKRLKREANENKHKEMMKQYESLKTLLQKFIEKDGL